MVKGRASFEGRLEGGDFVDNSRVESMILQASAGAQGREGV
jgi:hypothetical protein